VILNTRLPGRMQMDDLGVREVGLEDADNATTSVDHGKKFDSMVVLEFSTRVPPPAIQWILDKVKLSKRKGGSELMVCPVMDENREVCCLRPCMGSGVVRIDLLHFLARCHKRRLNQALCVLSLSVGFF